MPDRRAAVSLVSLLVLSACGESYADVYPDQLALKRKLVTTLEAVRDAPSAEMAKRNLQTLIPRCNAVAERLEQLGEISPATRQEVEAPHAEENADLGRRWMQLLTRIAEHQELMAIVEQAMRELPF